MADNVVSIEELRVIAEYFCTVELPYYTELNEAFRLLRLTGCRINEIFEIERWSIVSGYQVKFIPQKKNSERLILLDSSFVFFLMAIENQYKPFLGRTQYQLQYIFSVVNPWGKLYSGEKEITNYFFRYLYVRELAELGLNSVQIAEIMGYSSDQAVSNYLNADLGSTEIIPVSSGVLIGDQYYDFIEIQGQKWINRDLEYLIDPVKYRQIPLTIFNPQESSLLYTIQGMQLINSLLPIGWKIPENADWQRFINSFGSEPSINNQLKINNPYYWNPNTGNNLALFNAKGLGYIRNTVYSGKLTEIRYWSNTPYGTTRWYQFSVNASTAKPIITYTSINSLFSFIRVCSIV